MLQVEVLVIRNDEYSVEEIQSLHPSHLIIGPGPGHPAQAGIIVECILKYAGKFPILGICLGHQAIAHAFGGNVTRAKQPMHGKTSEIMHEGTRLFQDIPQGFTATRYHSLLVEQASFPQVLKITAQTKDNEIMGLRHISHSLFGVQFHPESILSQHGQELFTNFLKQ